MSVAIQRAFLTTAFSDTTGGVRIAQFESDSPTIHVIGEDSDSTCLRDDVESWVDLRTTSGEVVGCCVLLDSPEEANEFVESHDEPSLALRGADGTIAFVYLLSSPIENDDLPTNAPLPSTVYSLAFEEDIPDGDAFTLRRYAPDAVLAWLAPEEEAASLDTFNDATIYGVLDEEILSREIVVSHGTGRKCQRWVPHKMAIVDFIAGLSSNKVGQKDGPAFTQGEIEGPERRGNLVTRQHIFGLDVDCGYDIDTVHRIIGDLGLLAVIYTTHSHLTTKTEIAESALTKWADRNNIQVDATACRRYLVEERGYLPAIVENLVFHGRQMVQGVGASFVCEHAPMPKFRLVFFLDHPFDVMKEGDTTDAARKKWVRKIYGMARILGNLPIDQSCIDLSRLFYLPRRKTADSTFEIRIIAGKLLNLDEVPEVDPKKTDLFESVAAKLGGNNIKDSRTLANGMTVRRWAKLSADGFQIAELFRDYAPDRIRQDQSEDKLTVECPFDDQHSNAGDNTDAGCWVLNGASATSDSGFTFACSHNGCKKYDRLDMLCEAIDKGWFPEEALVDPNYQALDVTYEEEKEETEDDTSKDADDGEDEDEDVPEELLDSAALAALFETLSKRSDALTETSSPRDSREILRRAVFSGLQELDVGKIAQKVAKNTKTRIKHVDEEIKKLRKLKERSERRREAAENREADLEAEEQQFIRQNHIRPVRGTTLFYTGAYQSDEYAYAARLTKVFTAQNDKNPRVFDYSGSKIVAVLGSNNRFSIIDVTEKILVEEANKVITKVVPEDEGFKRVRISIDDVVPILADVDVRLPPVERFEEMPYYTPDGRIVRDTGYDRGTRTLLARADGIDIPDFAFDRNPSQDLVDEAVNELFGTLFVDFPFDDAVDTDTNGNGSRCHLLAMMLQPIVRLMINGPTPFYLVDKPSPGTGGSLIVKTGLTVSSGAEEISTETEKTGQTDEEWRKTITSSFIAGKKDIFLDNINHRVTSSALANLATASVWEDRILGKSTMVRYRNLTRVVIVGNNVTLSDELLRRCVMTRIDYKQGDPTQREKNGGFKIDNIETHTKLMRGRYYAYLMVLVNRWIACGRPEFTDRTLASFESWARVMGGIMQAAEIDGFLSNLHLTSGSASTQKTALNMFATGIFQKWGFERLPLTDLLTKCESWGDIPPVQGINQRTFESMANFMKFMDGIKGMPFTVYRPGHEDGDFFGRFSIESDPVNPLRSTIRIRYSDNKKNREQMEKMGMVAYDHT